MLGDRKFPSTKSDEILLVGLVPQYGYNRSILGNKKDIIIFN